MLSLFLLKAPNVGADELHPMPKATASRRRDQLATAPRGQQTHSELTIFINPLY